MIGNPITSALVTPKWVTGANPAANTEITDAVPAGKVWELLGIAFTLAQGATQTPLPTLVIDDGTSTVGSTVGYQAPCASSAQNASVTARYFIFPGLTLSAGGAATSIYSPFPLGGLILPAGSRISTSTAGKGANTDYGAPLYLVVEYG